jgi:cytoskeleton protein RodZ
MPSLGPYLSGLRQQRGLSIEEMVRVMRVASGYLEALEREDFGALPAPVFTKGYIRAYCQVVGVPPEEALRRYAESAGMPIAAVPAAAGRPASRTADNGGRGRETILVSFVLLVGFGLALFVVTLFLQSGRPDGKARRAEAPASTVELRPLPAAGTAPAVPPPGVATPLSAPAAATAAQGPAASAPRGAETAPAPSPETRPATDTSHPPADRADLAALRLGAVTSPYRLVVRTSEVTWLRVRTDDGRATEETIPAGEVREWVSNRPFVLSVGNAGGITLELNGRTLPPLGGRGAVVRRLVLPPAEP